MLDIFSCCFKWVDMGKLKQKYEYLLYVSTASAYSCRDLCHKYRRSLKAIFRRAINYFVLPPYSSSQMGEISFATHE